MHKCKLIQAFLLFVAWTLNTFTALIRTPKIKYKSFRGKYWRKVFQKLMSIHSGNIKRIVNLESIY